MPVGFIIETTDATSPAEIFGGSWELFGKGRVIVGYDPNDADFNWVWDNTEEKFNESGEKKHTLTVNEMPSHNHNFEGRNGANYFNPLPKLTDNSGNTNTVPTSYTGGNQPHNNLQPYIVAYRWRRVA